MSAPPLDRSSNPTRVAVLCFYPDWGHMLPLLKIARAARDSGHQVRCYFPERGRDLCDKYGISLFGLNIGTTFDASTLKKMGSRSIFFFHYSGYVHTSLFADPKIIGAVSECLYRIVDDAKGFAPDIVISDLHLFSPVYEFIANACGAQYVRNEPSGTLAHEHRPYISMYGDDRASVLLMTLVEQGGRLFRSIYRPAFYLRHLSAWRASRSIKAELRRKISGQIASDATESWKLTAGLSWIEDNLLGSVRRDTNPLHRDFPPLGSSPEAIPPRLEAWLRASSGPVIYISFGSILGLSEDSYRAIGSQLVALGYRVIWSTPLGDTSALRHLSDNPKFYITDYVPQSELLKRPEISCFITHGGAGSVCEALMGGTPMLCVPLHADNGYISWIVERLGNGRRIWKRNLHSSKFYEAVKDLVENPKYRRRADEISNIVQSADAENRVVEFLNQIAERKRTKL